MPLTAFKAITLMSMKRILKMSISGISLTISCFYAGSLAAKDASYDLILAGGALKTCSSFSTKNCENLQRVRGGKKENLYQISLDGFKRWTSLPPFSEISNASKLHIYAYLESLDTSSKRLSRRQFLSRIDDIAKDDDFTRQLSDPAYFSLLDSFEVIQVDSAGNRLIELVSVDDNKNRHAQRVYDAFKHQASMRLEKAGKTTLLVVTASSRDPFESADFYLGALAGDDFDVIWLPIDKAWQQAVDLERQGYKGCENLALLRQQNNQFYRERVYPQRAATQYHYCKHPEDLVRIIKQSQGIFFNGGDQSKTLGALLTPDGSRSIVLDTIFEQVKNAKLVVGGTSAGTAVQAGGVRDERPVPMLTNGDSSVAMSRGVFAITAPSQRCTSSASCDSGIKRDDLTVRTAGGTGLFDLGLLDTHFSERDRETRLAVATFDSKQRLGFGVDETTALLVKYDPEGAIAKVVGDGGVFVVDFTQGQSVQNLENKEPMRQLAGEAHYFPDGVEFIVDNGNIRITSEINPLTKRDKTKESKSGQWRLQVAERCGSGQSIKWQQFGNIYVLKRSEQTQFFTTDRQQCGYSYLPFVISHS